MPTAFVVSERVPSLRKELLSEPSIGRKGEAMHRLRDLSRGGRVLVALVVGGAVFGIATAVQASIPDASGVIHGCYFKFPNGEMSDRKPKDAP